MLGQYITHLINKFNIGMQKGTHNSTRAPNLKIVNYILYL